ncbi:MAG: hypothetical protein ACI88C_000715 [Acidimicrobiales bacterium]
MDRPRDVACGRARRLSDSRAVNRGRICRSSARGFELLAVPDDCAVEEFSSDGSDPAFGERIGLWGPNIASWLVRLRFGIRG